MNHKNKINGYSTVHGILILGIFAVWQSFEFLFFGPASAVIFADNAEQLLPSLLTRLHADHVFAAWDRFQAGGNDVIAGADHALINIALFALFPAWLANGILTLAMYIAAGVGVFLLAHKRFQLSSIASSVAGMVYMTQVHPYLASAVFCFLPLCIYTVSQAVHQATRKHLLFAIASIILLAFTGYFSRVIPYASIMLFVWFLIVERPTKVSSWLTVIGACILIVFLRIKDVVVLLFIAPLSHTNIARVTVEPEQAWAALSSPPWFLNTTTAIICFAIMVITVIFFQQHRWKIAALTGIILCGSAIIEISLVSIQQIVIPYWPTISGFRFTYFGALTNLGLALGSACGISAFQQSFAAADTRKDALGAPTWFRLGFYGSLIVVTALIGFGSIKQKYTNMLSWVTNGSNARHFESKTLATIKTDIDHRALPVRVEPYQIAPAVISSYGLETAGGYTPVYYKHYYELWGSIVKPWANQQKSGTRFGDMYAAIRESRGGKMQFRGDRLMLYPLEYAPAVNLGTLYDLDLLSLANVGYFVSRDRLVGEGLKLISGPEKAWSSLSQDDKTAFNIRANFNGLDPLFVYENTRVVERFFSVQGIQGFETDADVIDHLESATLPDLLSAAPMNRAMVEALNTDVTEFAKLDNLRIEKYSDDNIRLALGAARSKPSLLIVSNTYSPFWKAMIDGQPAQIVRAYHTFWAIEIPAAAKYIDFMYRPPYAVIPG